MNKVIFSVLIIANCFINHTIGMEPSKIKDIESSKIFTLEQEIKDTEENQQDRGEGYLVHSKISRSLYEKNKSLFNTAFEDLNIQNNIVKKALLSFYCFVYCSEKNFIDKQLEIKYNKNTSENFLVNNLGSFLEEILNGNLENFIVDLDSYKKKVEEFRSSIQITSSLECNKEYFKKNLYILKIFFESVIVMQNDKNRLERFYDCEFRTNLNMLFFIIKYYKKNKKKLSSESFSNALCIILLKYYEKVNEYYLKPKNYS